MNLRRKGWETGVEGKTVTEDERDRVYKILEGVAWKPHPLSEKIKTKILLTRDEDGTDCTIFIGMVPKGEALAEHIHEHSDDIIYPLSGKAKLWIRGIGDFELKIGVIAKVPKGVLHKVYDVSEDFYALDVFAPPIL